MTFEDWKNSREWWKSDGWWPFKALWDALIGAGHKPEAIADMLNAAGQSGSAIKEDVK